MKNSHKITTLIILLTTIISTAQEKLKGNKDVTTEDRNISDFTSIEIIDNLNVFLVSNENQSVTVEADSNLQSSILTEINNGKLIIKTSDIIGRSKSLNIHLNINKKINEINTYNKAKIISKNLLKIDDLTINSFNDASLKLNLKLKNIQINGKEKSKLNLEILSDEISMKIENSCNLTAEINTKKIDIIGLDKAITSLKGTTDSLNIEFSGDSQYKGKDFKAATASVKSNNKSNLYVYVTNVLDLYTKNSSEVNLYGNPEITLHEFYDKALIRKKEL